MPACIPPGPPGGTETAGRSRNARQSFFPACFLQRLWRRRRRRRPGEGLKENLPRQGLRPSTRRRSSACIGGFNDAAESGRAEIFGTHAGKFGSSAVWRNPGFDHFCTYPQKPQGVTAMPPPCDGFLARCVLLELENLCSGRGALSVGADAERLRLASDEVGSRSLTTWKKRLNTRGRAVLFATSEPRLSSLH